MPPASHPPLPSRLRRYFWDYRDGAPSGAGRDETVVVRLLQDGGLDATRWLRQSVGDAAVRQVLTSRRGRGLSPKRLRFWGLVLDLPRDEVDGWVARARAAPWHTRARP